MKGRHILMAIAPNQGIDQRYDVVFEFADRTQSQVTVLCVVDDLHTINLPANTQGSALDLLTLAEQQAHQYMDNLLETVRSIYTDAAFSVQVSSGAAHKQIVAHAQQLNCDMLVIDANSRQKRSAACFGSTTRQLMRTSPIPVWVLGHNKLTEIKHVAVAIDVSAQQDGSTQLNQELMRQALNFSQQAGAHLHLVHVWRLEGEGHLRHWSNYSEIEIATLARAEKQARAHALEQLTQALNAQPSMTQIHLLEGNAEEKIAEFTQSQPIDVLVMSTACRTGLAGALMGNTAEKMLDKVSCSVYTIKANQSKPLGS